jgi:hypothetical protein
MKSKNLIISVYKTNILEKDLIDLISILNNFNEVNKWSVDLEDCENILRIESYYSVEKETISKLHFVGIECVELH